MISADNIPEEMLIGSDGMTVVEVKNANFYGLITNSFAGHLFHTAKDGRFYIKANKSFIDGLKLKFNKS